MGHPAEGQQRVRDVLAVYKRPRDPDIPLVCLDETSQQLTAEMRAPIQMKERRPARFDYEYERNGTANIFMMFVAKKSIRTSNLTSSDLSEATNCSADSRQPSAQLR
jgi:hypothetical protein